MKIINVVGARPNFMKIAPLHRAFQSDDFFESKIVHTGQHYDERMSDIFFNQLELPKPDYYLGIGGGSHTYQKANVMLAFEKVIQDEKPDLVLVVGDVNATAACSIVAVKMGIPVAHVEAGLRSFDRKMPEEINRMITDAISDYLFVTEQSGMINLAKENVADDKAIFIGNVMIDSLVYYREKASKLNLTEILSNVVNKSTEHTSNIAEQNYILTTMHRPSNVDNVHSVKRILEILKNAAEQRPVIFPIHPRTANNFEKFGLTDELHSISNLYLLGPQGYLQFLYLMDRAAMIITDSGGIQEETTFLQVPCLTFRDSTERPVTVDLGTNQLLADLDPETVRLKMMDILEGRTKEGVIPPLWDGNTAKRIAKFLKSKYPKKQINEVAVN